MKRKQRRAEKSGKRTAAPGLRQASVQELQAELPSAPQLLDVRTGLEFRGGRVPGALNQPLGSIDYGSLDKNREVWVICKSGARSIRAGQDLASEGFRVVNVQGGVMAWESAGFSMEGKGGAATLFLPAIAALTLGLAPFVPEPHIWGKLRWIAGGGEGMAGADVFDLLMHGAPWLWLAWAVFRVVRARSAA
jgi:rhodanese-related sulfurtransferase